MNIFGLFLLHEKVLVSYQTFTFQFQTKIPAEQRQELSVSQQGQILSDVQKHQHQFRSLELESQISTPNSSLLSYPSLEKYKTGRGKQKIQQLQRIQQRPYQQQQQQLTQESSKSYMETTHNQYTPSSKHQQTTQYRILTPGCNNHYQAFPPNYVKNDLFRPYFTDDQTVLTQNYSELQRQVEISQKNREQLVPQKEDLIKQQEYSKLAQLQKMAELATPLLAATNTRSRISTASSPLFLSSIPAKKNKSEKNELFVKAVGTHQKDYSIGANFSPLMSLRPLIDNKTKLGTVRSHIPESRSQDTLLLRFQGHESNSSNSQINFTNQTEEPPFLPPTSGRENLLSHKLITLNEPNNWDKRNLTIRYIFSINKCFTRKKQVYVCFIDSK